MTDYAAVQKRLNELGTTPPLVVDGNYGPKSRAAVMTFQQSKGLVVDGLVGPMTLAALGLSGSVAPSGGGSKPATELPNRATPMSGEDVIKAIADGYKRVTGKVAAPNVLNLLVSQAAFETGDFAGKGIHNFNFGNKKYSSGDPYFQFFRCNEFIDGKEVWNDRCKFAAYDSPAQAGEAFVRLLMGRPHWWAGLQSGDSTTFVKALSTTPKYFTGNPSDYLAGVNRYFSQYAQLAAKYATPGVGAGIAVALVGLAYAAWRIGKLFV